MGRFLGSYDGEEIDRPDLNKCPDCGCFFASDNCPLCGKPCPEEFRAGNRKPLKKKKHKGNSSSRTVTFMDWYHQWWVIILALIFFPIMGIILLLTSPHKKSIKIAVGVVAIIWGLTSAIGIGNIVNGFNRLTYKPVDTSLSREEYIAACSVTDPEQFYRNAEDLKGEYVAVTVIVNEKFRDADAEYNGNDYPVYYECTDGSGREFTILIRDCIIDSSENFMPGDVITVYGEGDGEISVYDEFYEVHSAPCLNAAYVE